MVFHCLIFHVYLSSCLLDSHVFYRVFYLIISAQTRVKALKVHTLPVICLCWWWYDKLGREGCKALSTLSFWKFPPLSFTPFTHDSAQTQTCSHSGTLLRLFPSMFHPDVWAPLWIYSLLGDGAKPVLILKFASKLRKHTYIYIAHASSSHTLLFCTRNKLVILTCRMLIFLRVRGWRKGKYPMRNKGNKWCLSSLSFYDIVSFSASRWAVFEII